jgi:hypothetical protein
MRKEGMHAVRPLPLLPLSLPEASLARPFTQSQMFRSSAPLPLPRYPSICTVSQLFLKYTTSNKRINRSLGAATTHPSSVSTPIFSPTAGPLTHTLPRLLSALAKKLSSPLNTTSTFDAGGPTCDFSMLPISTLKMSGITLDCKSLKCETKIGPHANGDACRRVTGIERSKWDTATDDSAGASPTTITARKEAGRPPMVDDRAELSKTLSQMVLRETWPALID